MIIWQYTIRTRKRKSCARNEEGFCNGLYNYMRKEVVQIDTALHSTSIQMYLFNKLINPIIFNGSRYFLQYCFLRFVWVLLSYLRVLLSPLGRVGVLRSFESELDTDWHRGVWELRSETKPRVKRVWSQTASDDIHWVGDGWWVPTVIIGTMDRFYRKQSSADHRTKIIKKTVDLSRNQDWPDDSQPTIRCLSTGNY